MITWQNLLVGYSPIADYTARNEHPFQALWNSSALHNAFIDSLSIPTQVLSFTLIFFLAITCLVAVAKFMWVFFYPLFRVVTNNWK